MTGSPATGASVRDTTMVPPPAATGLTQAEAQRRLAERGELRRPATSRSYLSIVRANVFTVFNLILAVFGALTLSFGDWRDALFLGILVANTTIGVSQEVRAKRALDRLALLVSPRARVVRDGELTQRRVDEVVVGDLVRLEPGDQLVADGDLVADEGLTLDESILTGESRPVMRRTGDEVRSGAFVEEGTGAMLVTAVGEESYAQRLTGEARSFRHPRSPLERALNRLLLALVGLVVVLGGVLGYALWHRQASTRDAVATSTAGVVSLIPEGLLVLMSLTFAVGAIRMARRGVLAQQLNAIESLASADVICLDKTGTLTESSLRLVSAIPEPGVEEAELKAALGRYAAAAPVRDEVLDALADAQPAPAEQPVASVPFSSRRRWSAYALGDRVFVLGAPELFDLGPLEEAATRETEAGRRVLGLAEASTPLAPAGPEDPPPAGAKALGLAVLAEELRPNIQDTIQFLRQEDVEIKVLSGDAPATVAAIARDAGLKVDAVEEGGAIPSDPAELGEFVQRINVIGRISPEGKRAVVNALRESGRYVAMVGDGVNDVPALKSSRLALAQGTGAQMAKSVADLVLVKGDFAVVPEMIHEGRQMLRNLHRVAKLYVTKSSFAAFLILLIGTTSTAYPLLPRHFSIAASLTIGIPSFFLALAPSSGPWREEGFVRDVARFAVPTGFIVGVGVLASYLFALEDLDATVREARTVATTVLVGAGLYLILVLEASSWRRGGAVGLLCAVLGGLYVLALLLPATREFFQLTPIDLRLLATSLAGIGVAVAFLYIAGFTPGEEADVGDDSG